ncbi:MAG: AAA domain-containing protein [Candidatus Moranbacteria bacterium]|nr:AAA domain-containing protein [Candidatus Moranbacteria bacterium]
MESAQVEINQINCDTCRGSGWVNSLDNACQQCGGKGYVQEVRGIKLYWGEKMRAVPPLIRKSIRRLSAIIEIGSWALGLLFTIVGGLNLYDSLKAHQNLKPNLHFLFDLFFAGWATAFFWLGLFLMVVVLYHRAVFMKRKPISLLEKDYQYILADQFKQKNKPIAIDISQSADLKTLQVLANALDLAYSKNQAPNTMHLLYALMMDSQVHQLFQKLEIPVNQFIKQAGRDMVFNQATKNIALDGTYKNYLFQAFWEAVKTDEPTIKPKNLLFVIISQDFFRPILNKYTIQAEDFHNVSLWNKYKNLKVTNFLSKKSYKKPPHHIMNRSWSAVQTKTLDQFSTDLTDYARVGWLLPLVNRDKEMRMLTRVLQRSSKNNILLIGQEGSGRDAMARGLARRIVRNKVPSLLRDKRLVKLNVGALGVGGGDGSLLKARVEAIMAELIKTKNVIIYIPDIHNLSKVKSVTSMDIISFLAPLFSKSVIQVIGSTTLKGYRRHIEPRGEFAQTFDTIKIQELDKENSLKVLSIQIPIMEKANRVTITYSAAEEAIDKSRQFITNKLLPQKAIDVLAEAIVRAKNTKGKSLVTKNEVLEVFSEKTGIPVTKIGRDEAEELLNLEREIAKKVIGQPQAVKNTAAAIRRMRVRIGESERPIAVFMFLGPTGVGKTELSKALAQVYFGSRDRMTRIDMSEFATPYDLERLIGDSLGNVKGQLTESVRINPFSLVLLDEFEKAHPRVWDLFLQIFDDGRITDGQGRVVNFTNTILIATSNVGSRLILTTLEQGISIDKVKPQIKTELMKKFRPEFLNRFDDIIIFNALTHENIKQIALIEIKQLNQRLETEQGVTVKLTDQALDYLAKIGYSPEYGARFLKRTIRDKVEDAIVVGILKQKYQRGSEIVIDKHDMESQNR